MPEPSFLERLRQAALKVPGFRPATVNGERMSEFDMNMRKAVVPAARQFAEAHPEAGARAQAAIDYLRSKAQGTSDTVNHTAGMVGAPDRGAGAGAPVSMYLEDQPKAPAFMQDFLNKHFVEPDRRAAQPPVIELDEPAPVIELDEEDPKKRK